MTLSRLVVLDLVNRLRYFTFPLLDQSANEEVAEFALCPKAEEILQELKGESVAITLYSPSRKL